MRSFVLPLLCAALFLLGCQQENKQWTKDRVISLHERIDSLRPDSSYYYLKQIEREIARNPLLDSLTLKNHYLLGNYFITQGILDSSAYHYHEAVNRVQPPLDYNKGANYFFKAHEAYRDLGKFGDCIAIANQYLNGVDENDYKALALGYQMLSDANLWIGNIDKAISQNEAQIRALKNTEDSVYMYTSFLDKANLIYYYKKDPRATFHIMDSLLGIKDYLTNDQLRVLYGNYGVYQFFESDFQKSKDYYEKSLAHIKLLKNMPDLNSFLAVSYANLAEVCIELREFSQAKKYLDTIKTIGLHNIPRRIRKSVLRYELKLANATDSNLTNLYDHLDTIAKYQELSYNEKIQNELVELTKANEKEKQILQEKLETEIANANLKTSLLWGGVGVSLLFSFGLLFYFRRKLKFERNSLQLQQRLLRSQMNPHFTFNTLYAIQSQIKKEPEAATNYLLKFSRLLRLFLENSMGDYIPLEKEIESLKKYMDLQKLRSIQKFEYHFHYENMEEDELLFIPPMLLQPFIENSIEHGFAGIDYPGKVDIYLSLEDKFIHCTIEDNGNGLTAKQKSAKQSASTRLISDFLKKLTGKELEVIDKKDKNPEDSGTLVQFSIPYTLTENG